MAELHPKDDEPLFRVRGDRTAVIGFWLFCTVFLMLVFKGCWGVTLW